MLYVYTGKGEGKTSSAIGKVIRALGYGKKVVVIQFMKGRESGESKFLSKLARSNKNLKFYKFGSKKFMRKGEEHKEHKLEAEKAMKKAREALKQRPFLLVLDELGDAVYFKLVKLDEVLDLINSAGKTNIIITGVYVPRKIKKVADLVSEIKEIKHPYKRGQLAKKGLDY